MDEIEVVFNDGMFGFVSPEELDRLIESREIVKFLRGEAWVYLGVDPMRATSENPLAGERSLP